MTGAGLVSNTLPVYFNEVPDGILAPQQSIYIFNENSTPTKLTPATMAGAQASDFTLTNNCPLTVAPNTGCQIAITFKPSIVGPESSTLTYVDDTGNSQHRVKLIGIGGPPIPTLSSLSPTIVAASVPFILTVNGAGFTASSTVLFNGYYIPTTFFSPTEVTATIPATMIPGTFSPLVEVVPFKVDFVQYASNLLPISVVTHQRSAA